MYNKEMRQNCDIIAALSAYITRPIIRRLIILLPANSAEYLHYNRKMRELHGGLIVRGYSIIRYYDNCGYSKPGDKFRNNNYDGILYKIYNNNNTRYLSLYDGYKNLTLLDIAIINNKVTYMRLDEIMSIYILAENSYHIMYYNHCGHYNIVASITIDSNKTILKKNDLKIRI